MSWLGKLEKAKAEIAKPNVDLWRLRLERVRGQLGDDGIERVTTQTLFDILEVTQRSRRAGACRRLAKLMTELGWTAVRVRGLTRGGYLEQVRGYAKEQSRSPLFWANGELTQPISNGEVTMMTNQMEAKPTPKEVMRAIRDLERKGLIVSRLDRNGEVRWYITGKPYYEDALDDADDSEELLHYTEASWRPRHIQLKEFHHGREQVWISIRRHSITIQRRPASLGAVPPCLIENVRPLAVRYQGKKVKISPRRRLPDLVSEFQLSGSATWLCSVAGRQDGQQWLKQHRWCVECEAGCRGWPKVLKTTPASPLSQRTASAH